MPENISLLIAYKFLSSLTWLVRIKDLTQGLTKIVLIYEEGHGQKMGDREGDRNSVSTMSWAT